MKVIDFDKQITPTKFKSTTNSAYERLQRYKEENTVISTTILELKIIKDNPYWILDFDGVRGIIEFERTGLSHPAQMDSYVGQEVFVKIFHIKQSEKGILVSADRKVVIDEVHDRLFETLEVGQVIPSVVRGMGDNTVHVDIGGGVTVPIERKEATLSKRHTSLRNLFQIGDTLDVRVMEVDIIERTIKVSHTATCDDVWMNAKYSTGDVVVAEIVHISNKAEPHTIFVEVKPGMDALLAFDVRTEARIKTEEKVELKVGIRIRCRVTKFDPDAKRLRVRFQAFI